MSSETASWVDATRSVRLNNDHYSAVVILCADGSEHLVLLNHKPVSLDRPTLPCSTVGYEQLGPLPPQWAARAALTRFRCGRTTLAGHRCRVYVSRPGDTCRGRNTSTA
jgi:hypothetical protein